MTRRGFGIHSPRAYWLVTEVLRDSRHYGLYDYDSTAIKALPKPQRKAARRRLRLAAFARDAVNPIYLENPAEEERRRLLSEMQAEGVGILIEAEDFIYAERNPQIAFTHHKI